MRSVMPGQVLTSRFTDPIRAVTVAGLMSALVNVRVRNTSMRSCIVASPASMFAVVPRSFSISSALSAPRRNFATDSTSVRSAYHFCLPVIVKRP